MPNKNYIKGRRKEYKICKELRDDGYDIVQRTAGSHSPVDLFAIKKETKEILFVQSKPDDFSKTETEKINQALDFLNDDFKVRFILY